MRIDLFAHGMSPDLRNEVMARTGPDQENLANWTQLTTLFDMKARGKILDACEVDLQVLTTPSPPLEVLFEGEELREMTRLANDSMAALTIGDDRYLGTVSVPLCDPDFAVEELRRGVGELGLVGPQVFSSSQGQPLDWPHLEPFWSEVESLGVPVWLHPERSPSVPDYPTEERSLYGMFLVLGWPYETSVAMSRLVLSGVMDRHPGLDIIVHHAGAMIPFFS
ncbi:MAG: amidohydrolase family protein, partial [Acidimicrobiia bacterium]|nr:amidohydrolase family protein [Acidimicrobiia bacterium]